MSRIKKFTASLWSAQFALVANILYTAASVPLALRYLGKAEFGVWAGLVLPLTGYLALIDGGMTGAFTRLFIDHKDDKANGQYGAMFKLALGVSSLQGLLILLVGTAGSWSAAAFFELSPALARDFHWLFIGQCALTMAGFCLRTWGYVLYAHQRMDVGNHVATAQLLLSLGLLFWFFQQGCGIYSILYSNALSLLSCAWVQPWVCYRNGYMPRRGEFGKVSWEMAREAFGYGMDLFFIAIGSQLTMTSQALLIGKLMGLEAAAVWSVMTRSFNMVCQVVWKVPNIAWPALTEMFVRRETELFKNNLRDLTVLCGCLAAVAAAGLAVCNNDFNQVWTSGQIVWNRGNNVLLGLWFFLITLYRCYSGLPILAKQLGIMKLVCLGEGVVYIGAVWLWPMTMRFSLILGLSLLTSTLFSGAYGVKRSAEILQMPKREVLRWALVPLATLTGAGTAGALAWMCLQNAPLLARFIGSALLTASVGGWLTLRHGISEKYAAKLPPFARKFCKIIGGM